MEPRFVAGLNLGYSSGFVVQGHGMAWNFAEGFPLRARLGFAYVTKAPGRPLDARRVFINNATNGIPEESGQTWSFKLDLRYPVSVLALPRSYVHGGVRHARFRANFKFVGGNEDFDVTSNHWGLGAGLESYFAVSRRLDLVLTGGVDYFFSDRLVGTIRRTVRTETMSIRVRTTTTTTPTPRWHKRSSTRS